MSAAELVHPFRVGLQRVRMKTRAKRFARSAGRRSFARPTTMQVAAICYRRSQFSIEFLLVNTSSGKWTFPKGRMAPEMSPWEAAQQEAIEEAGAMGAIEETCLGHYTDLKRALGHDNRSREILVAAYLLEVETMSVPQEPGRNPTWFTPAEAKERMAEQRAAKYSSEIARMIDAATSAIQPVSLQPSALSPRQIGPKAESLDGMDTL